MVEAEPQDHKREFNDVHGAILIVNGDNDENAPRRRYIAQGPPFTGRDWGEPAISVDADAEDLSAIKVQKIGVGAIPEGVTIRLSIEPAETGSFINWFPPPAESSIRIYHRVPNAIQPPTFKYFHLAGREAGSAYNFKANPGPEDPDIRGQGEVTLWAEGCEHAVKIFLVLTAMKDGQAVAQDRVLVMPTPFILLPNTLPVEKVFVSSLAAKFGPRLKEIVGAGRIADGFTDTPFIQDYFEAGTSSKPLISSTQQIMPAAIQLVRQAGWSVGDYMTVQMSRPIPDAANTAFSWIELFAEGFFADASYVGGNIEVSPPLAHMDPSKNFPLGRIVVGNNLGTSTIAPEGSLIKQFLIRQRIQAKRTVTGFHLLELPTRWLHVGHIDEIISFISGPGSRGFLVVIADPALAFQLLPAPPGGAMGSGSGSFADSSSGSGGSCSCRLDDERNWRTFLYDSASDKEVASCTTADSDVNTLIDADIVFEGHVGLGEVARNGGFRYVRIYDSPDQSAVGQVAEVDPDNSSGSRLRIRRRWFVPNVAAAAALLPVFGTGATIVGSPTWLVPPPACSRYVLVENSKLLWEDVPVFITAQEVRIDPDLRLKNLEGNDSPRKNLDDAREILMAELGLVETDFVRVPVMFAPNENAPERGRRFYGYFANLANLVVVNDSSRHYLLMQQPHAPRIGIGGKDVYQEHCKQILPMSDDDFIDEWKLFHERHGELHCGSNVRRQPTTLYNTWWNKWPTGG